MKTAGSAAWFAGVAAVLFVLTPSLGADHHWWNGSLHWPAFPVVDVTVGDNVSADWTPFLDEAVLDWNAGHPDFTDVVELMLANGATSPRNCRPAAGRIEVCNSGYGDNGWLGTTQAWLANHDGHVHITQATVKLNDTYLDLPDGYYNDVAWWETVVCHELGHTIGLGHLDETFDNDALGSCMDYQDPPDENMDPNALDFDTLDFIYSEFFTGPHPTTSSTSSGPGKGKNKLQANPGEASSWGQLVASGVRESVFEAELADGQRLVTWVLWAN